MKNRNVRNPTVQEQLFPIIIILLLFTFIVIVAVRWGYKSFVRLVHLLTNPSEISASDWKVGLFILIIIILIIAWVNRSKFKIKKIEFDRLWIILPLLMILGYFLSNHFSKGGKIPTSSTTASSIDCYSPYKEDLKKGKNDVVRGVVYMVGRDSVPKFFTPLSSDSMYAWFTQKDKIAGMQQVQYEGWFVRKKPSSETSGNFILTRGSMDGPPGQYTVVFDRTIKIHYTY